MAESSERVSAAPEIVYDDGTVLVCVKQACCGRDSEMKRRTCGRSTAWTGPSVG